MEIHGMRASITTRRRRRRRRSDCLPPSSIPVNPLARTTTTRSHRPRYTEARLCLKSERTDALQLTTCILVKVSLRFTVDFVYFVNKQSKPRELFFPILSPLETIMRVSNFIDTDESQGLQRNIFPCLVDFRCNIR